MSGTNPNCELEANAVANSPPNDTVGESISDKKGKELNGSIEVINGEGEKEREKDYDVKMIETEDPEISEVDGSKITETDDFKITEVEDSKVMEEDKILKKEGTEDLKVVEKGDEEEEGKKMEGENNVMEEKNSENMKKKFQESKEAEGLNKKRVRGQKIGEKGESKERKVGGVKVKALSSTPLASNSIDRPVRERKTVERLVESLEKESFKPFLIEKGRGTPLKDIPNVASKLAKRKPPDLKLLHQTIFGRIGKAIDYKNHLLQFSGFVWHENEEKQKTKVKEKLDKCMKETLIDLCDLFDLPGSKANTRKEELVAMLLDFMVVPHATANAILAHTDQQSTKSTKRKRVTTVTVSKTSGDRRARRPREKRIKSEDKTKRKRRKAHETEDEEEEENGVAVGDDAPHQNVEEELESEENDDDDDDKGKGKGDIRMSSKKGGSSSTKKSKMEITLSKRTKSPRKTSFLKHSKDGDGRNVSMKVSSSKKKNAETSKKKSVPSKKNAETSKKKSVPTKKNAETLKKKSAPSKPASKEKSSGKKVGKHRAKSKEAEESGPTKEELRKTICRILNKVDFNTATVTDLMNELASHFSMDLTTRKGAINLILQEEMIKLVEAEDHDDDEEVGETP